MTITAATFLNYFETDVGATAITAYINDAYDLLEERVGAQGSQTAVLYSDSRYLILPQPIADAADITSISERFNDTTNVLTTNDWRWNGGRILERLSSGNPTFWGTSFGWACDVVVVYTPKDDANRRDRIVVDLVKLAIQYNGLASERAGDYQMSADDYTARRDSLARQLVTTMGFA